MAFAPGSFSFLSKYYLQPLILVIFYINLLCFQHVRAASNETDYLALLKFKESITDDPHEILSSWNSSKHFCSWTGITCGHKHQRVTKLNLGGYQLGGIISPHIGNLSFVRYLSLSNNSFHGEIPPELGHLFRLKKILLPSNTLTGEIPWNLTSCTELRIFSLRRNSLSGTIPYQLGALQKLEQLQLFGNNLTGKIPLSIWNLTSLTYLGMGDNKLEGRNLKNLGKLDISRNNLSREIPLTIGECTSMEYLNLQGNSFNGPMPPSLALMKGLEHLDLSQNNLSGPMLAGLQNISSLQYLNVSFNKFDGEVPTEGVFSNASAISISGNINLCGGISKLHLPPCPKRVDTQTKHNLKLMIILICVASSLFLIILFGLYWRRERNRKSSSSSPVIEQFPKVSYQNLHMATKGFSTNNLIEFGSFGSVYKGRLELKDKVVAIKVLNLQKNGAQKSFISECNALRNIRHRNLLKILTCCSSIDYKGQEFKALVFEYMSNRSLEKWLHHNQGSVPQSTLDICQRFNVIYDVASALHYLHYENEQPIVHCDLKPSNVLLDDDMVAHVSDFGLAKLLATLNGSSQKQASTSIIKGTIGYAPPEYGITSEVSIQGDIYSFGILILEMLTGKRPTDLIFEDGHNLHSYVKAAFPNNLLKIVDTTLVCQQVQQTTIVAKGEIRMEEVALVHPHHEKILILLFEIGLACSVESSKKRMNMMGVLRELNQIKNALALGERSQN
ncbi:putative receptor-like protein kinase At3g47110 [Neltuma alba]|uniref:putative receptor-like protein kinase At3g47110 n=1 Tax=Neltuma alba TaxID=207710 RepID=UPI0010A2BAFA|nr:putative receptor-like protein kinase At3g47110 [Prosopis alba]